MRIFIIGETISVLIGYVYFLTQSIDRHIARHPEDPCPYILDRRIRGRNKQFDKYIEEEAFVEYTRTFTYHYGTLKSEIERSIDAGLDILLELNVVGAENIKKLYPDDCVTIFIDPPSIEELKSRLVGRKSETPETLARRLAEIDFERTKMGGYDHLLINDVAADCADRILDIIKAEHQNKNK
jgi:guanylate kinase